MTTVKQTGPVVSIAGPLTSASVSKVAGDTESLFEAGSALTLDLAEVTDVDSATLALVVNWFKIAKQHRVSLRYSHIPPRLAALAMANGLADLLPS